MNNSKILVRRQYCQFQYLLLVCELSASLHVLTFDCLQVSGLAMSVSCGLTQSPEATMAALKAEQELQEVAVEFDCERNTELATLYLEARSKLEELKTQLKKQTKKEDLSNDLQLVTGEGIIDSTILRIS